MVKVYGWRKIDGYNPPNLYKQYRLSSQVDTLKQSADYTSDVYMSLQNRLGTIDIELYTESPYPPWNGTTVLLIEDYGYMSYMCNVLTSELISENVIRFTYDIDWYTSYLVTSLYYQTVGGRTHEVPVADRIMYLRKTGGSMNHSADGFQPRHIEYRRIEAVYPDTGELFNGGNSVESMHVFPILLAYHDPETDPSNPDNINWIMSYWRHDCEGRTPVLGEPWFNNTDNTIISAEKMWKLYKETIGYSGRGHEFNPKGVLFYGWLNINPNMLRFWKTRTFVESEFVYDWGRIGSIDVKFGMLVSTVIGSLTKWYTSLDGNGSFWPVGDFHNESPVNFRPFEGDMRIATEYRRFQLIDSDGSIIYEVPIGKTLDSMVITDVGFNFDATNPGIVFTVDYGVRGTYTEARTFTVPFRPLDFFLDSEQIYNVEEKVYSRELRNQQTMDSLVSGLTGAATTGATVYGFSRNTRSKKDVEEGKKSGTRKYQGAGDAKFKGLLGGGIATAGAIATFVYDSLYANQRYADIESARARVVADANLMTSNTPLEMANLCGFFEVAYDQQTISDITSFQSTYGYPDRTMETDKQLNTITGYVQADLILKGGMTKVAEDYVCSMFSNGVRFT